jgi:processing peptidase subunit beta
MSSLLQKGLFTGKSALRPGFRSLSTTANWLLSYPQTQVSTLDNGLRVASEKGQGETATVGVWIDAGSRFETPETNGVAHFLEHMSFKGTSKRSRVQLEKEVENLGGHLNAYTSREQTVFYAKVNKKDVPQAMDILADMLTDSQCTEEVVRSERDVILREMQEVNSQMEEVIFERLHETAYRGSMLGRTILGPEENIRTITRSMIADYVGAHYTAPRMVVAGAGAVEHDQLVSLSDKLLGNVPSTGTRPVQLEPAHFTGSDIRIRYDSMPMAHIAYAFPTAGWTDPDTYPLLVIASLLGNFDRNVNGGRHSSSELIANIATEDLAHSLSTFNTQYSDTGLFGVYATCDPYACNQLMHEVTRAMTSLCYNVEEELLEGAKNMLKMNLLSQHDGSTQICEEIGRQTLTYGRRMHPTEVLARIDAVDVNAIKLCANRFFYDTDFALAAIGPIDELPDYNWLRRKTYWLRY